MSTKYVAQKDEPKVINMVRRKDGVYYMEETKKPNFEERIMKG